VLGGAPALPAERAVWIPNAYDAMVYNTEAVRRRPYSMAWLSSPDRGLHRLLEMWPAIRARVPAATLRIFYRFDPWVSAHRQRDNLHGERARYIDAALAAFGRNGENGITVMGPVTHVDFVRELLGTWVVPYTYDPPGPMAEAFCIALLDACAAGCTPLCSDQDALGANFGDVAEVIPGRPGDSQGQWIDAIVIAATHENQGRRRARQRWARQFDRYRVAALWDSFLCANVHDGDRAAKLDTSMMPATMKEFAPCT
jgi:glycosyltransferase involved in cell wall biosynthesis